MLRPAVVTNEKLSVIWNKATKNGYVNRNNHGGFLTAYTSKNNFVFETEYGIMRIEDMVFSGKLHGFLWSHRVFREAPEITECLQEIMKDKNYAFIYCMPPEKRGYRKLLEAFGFKKDNDVYILGAK